MSAWLKKGTKFVVQHWARKFNARQRHIKIECHELREITKPSGSTSRTDRTKMLE